MSSKIDTIIKMSGYEIDDHFNYIGIIPKTTLFTIVTLLISSLQLFYIVLHVTMLNNGKQQWNRRKKNRQVDQLCGFGCVLGYISRTHLGKAIFWP